MIIIGLTGSIGMGKTTTANMLEAMGMPVHNSDAAVHSALAAGGGGVEPVAAAFPETFNQASQSIDRKLLGDLVFNDDARRILLEQIIHPIVVQSQVEFLAAVRASGKRMAVLDIPLLYETGAEKRVDVVIVVTCPSFIQRRRVLSRPNMTEDKFHAILARQIPDKEKRAKADFVVQTGFGQAVTRCMLERVISRLERNSP